MAVRIPRLSSDNAPRDIPPEFAGRLRSIHTRIYNRVLERTGSIADATEAAEMVQREEIALMRRMGDAYV